MSLIVYTTSHCPECNILKRFLHDFNVDYELRNCSVEPAYWDEVKNYGYLGVPLTIVNGKAIQGFKPQEIMEQIGQQKNI